MLRFAFCVSAVLFTVVGVSQNEAVGQGTEKSASTKSRATVAPRTVRSRNFSMRTDLGDADSEELLERLEKNGVTEQVDVSRPSSRGRPFWKFW